MSMSVSFTSQSILLFLAVIVGFILGRVSADISPEPNDITLVLIHCHYEAVKDAAFFRDQGQCIADHVTQ
eukprot:5843217-Amphidinium_carterae.2